MGRERLRFLLLLGTICSTSVLAGPTWEVRIGKPTSQPYDFIAVRMTSAGDSFVHPAINDFSVGNWALVWENSGTYPTIASASGPKVTMLYFDLLFAGEKNNNPLEFDIAYFKAGSNEILETTHMQWTGTSWRLWSGSWRPTKAELVPAPGALLLAGIGTAVVGWIRRRRLA